MYLKIKWLSRCYCVNFEYQIITMRTLQNCTKYATSVITNMHDELLKLVLFQVTLTVRNCKVGDAKSRYDKPRFLACVL